jgi:hypothetical protein
MFSSTALEVGIGVAFVFLFVSLICTAVREAIETVLKSRAADLERGLRGLPNDPDGTGRAKHFFERPLIFSLFLGKYDPQNAHNLPSYIPAGHFASALLDLVVRPPGSGAPIPATTLTTESLRSAAENVADEHLRRALLSAIDNAQGEVERVKANLESWFNGTMDRVSGWYKRRTQVILFGLGLAAAALLNVDAITVAERLSRDAALRESVVKQAERQFPVGTEQAEKLAEFQTKGAEELVAQFASFGFPVGWESGWPKPQKPNLQCVKGDETRSACIGSFYLPALITIALGWLITAFAVMLGAPFWFDVLNKFMVVRSTVKPKEKSLEEGSEDRRDPVKPQGATI